MKSKPAVNIPPVVVNAGRRTRRKEATRARILEAALQLLSTQEYNSTTVEQITEAADVGKGTFFNYFASKEHLLNEVSDTQLATIQTSVEKAVADNTDARRALKGLFLALAELSASSPTLARNLIQANLGTQAAREMLIENVRGRIQSLSRLVALGQRQEIIRNDIKPDLIARLYLHVYFGNLMYWALQPSLRLSGWMEFSFNQFWAGISNNGKSAQKRPIRKSAPGMEER